MGRDAVCGIRHNTSLRAGRIAYAVPDYLALMKSGVRQQYPSRLAVLAYLQQSPNAKALGFVAETAKADGKSGLWNPPLPQQ